MIPKIITRLPAYLWALPTTTVGLCIGTTALITRGHMQCVDGVLEFYGGFVTWLLENATLLKGGASAMTLGHIVLGRTKFDLDRTRLHERIHVAQCQRWGPLFIPAYLLASAWIHLKHRDPYRDNPFEKEAYANAP
jgi:hypothetical protein